MLEAIPLGEELNGELSQQEAKDLNGCSVIVIIGGQSEISQEVISERVGDVSTIQLQAKELYRVSQFHHRLRNNTNHKTQPRQKLEVSLSYCPSLLLRSPCSRWIPPMAAFVVGMRRQSV
jgi:hypothetical protein